MACPNSTAANTSSASGQSGLYVTEVARDGATFKLVSDTKLVEPPRAANSVRCKFPSRPTVPCSSPTGLTAVGRSKVAGCRLASLLPEAKPAARILDEKKANEEELLTALGHSDRDQRLRAQVTLSERFTV
jgi:hypothetical protein